MRCESLINEIHMPRLTVVLGGANSRNKIDSGVHGYTHEHMSILNSTQEEEILSHSLQIITSFLGKRPKGWPAPA